MRTKILMLGADAASLMADGQLLKDRGFLVMTAFNLQNIKELVNEVRPDMVFFDSHEPNNMITDACDSFINDPQFTHIPIVFTLADDDVYLVTMKRNPATDNRTIVTDNILDAVKTALYPGMTEHIEKQSRKIVLPVVNENRLFA